ncbi:MAG: hypothetical protein M9953_00360 [Thermomicrobiales bacterium]|nr:hypothetical protein [Thermomicrobiales bacterium]
MVELLRYLEEHDFKVFISSGGDRDFMRGVAEQMYGIPPEHVIGSSLKLDFQESADSVTVLYQEQMDVFMTARKSQCGFGPELVDVR